MANAYTRDCLVCGVPFTQVGIRGNLRRMCSNACSLRRIRERKNSNYMQRYHAVREAGGGREVARWAMQGRSRTAAALEVLKEERSGDQ